MVALASTSDQLQHLADALSLGSFYALVALGIGVVFSLMRLINFAHGELIMVGAYTASLLGDLPWPVMLVLPVIAAGAMALILERVAFRPIREANPATLMMTSFAASYLLQSIAVYAAGTLPKPVKISPFVAEAVDVGGIRLSRLDILSVAATIIVLIAFAAYLKRTTVGLRMRAAGEDFTMARLLGVRANRIVAGAFLISGLLAGVVALVLVAQGGTATPVMGQPVIIIGFVAAVIGGLGSLAGAALAGYLLGFAAIALQTWLPFSARGFRDAFLYGFVILVLLVRPHGLLAGRHARERV